MASRLECAAVWYMAHGIGDGIGANAAVLSDPSVWERHTTCLQNCARV